jgi:hypothetical protein
MDLFESYLRKQIKLLAARQRLPKDGRARLLSAASQLHKAGKQSRWFHRLHFRMPAFQLTTITAAIAALLELIWPPVNTAPFIEQTLPKGRSFYFHRDTREWSNGLLHLGLLCSSNSNSVGFHLRL